MKLARSSRFRRSVLTVLILLGIFTAVATWLARPTSAAWYGDTWGYRKKLTIDHTKVSGGADLSSFPILVSLSDVSLTKAQVGGNDILFTSSDGTTKLDHEIEKFTQNSGTLVAWVRIPTLSYQNDTIIYLYYGNPGSPNQQNKTGVWDTNYVMVQHLSETSGNHNDSKGSNNSSSLSVTQQGANIGKADGADEFNGSSNHVDIPDNNVLDFAGDFTVEAWVKFDQLAVALGHDQIILTKKNLTSPYDEYILDQINSSGNNYLDFQLENSATTGFHATYTGALATGTWYHVVGTKTSNVLKIYVNGSSTTGDTFTGSTFNGTDGFFIGDNYNNKYTDGVIDEVRCSASARTASWITTTYNTISNNPAFFSSTGKEEQNKQPIFYLKLDEGYGTTAHDSSANGASGTITGATWKSEDMCLSGKCLNFTGSNDVVNFGTSDLYNLSGDLTVSAWIKPNSYGGGSYGRIIERRTESPNKGYYFLLNNDGSNANTFCFEAYGVDFVCAADNSITLNQWQHVEAVRSGTNVILYLNGKQVGSGTINSITSAPGETLYLGNTALNGRNFDGSMDEVKIYDYARSVAQVQLDYNSKSVATSRGTNVSFGSSTTDALNRGLVGYWKMDEATWSGTLNEVIDSSGNGNHGQAGGATGGKAYPTGAKFGNGGYFDGVDDYVNVGDAATLAQIDSSHNWTISMWYKSTDSISDNKTLMYWYGASDGFTLTCGYFYGGNACRFQRVGSGYPFVNSTTNSFSANVWHHLVVTGSGSSSTIKFYNNGVDVTEGGTDFTWTAGTGNNKTIGFDYSSMGWRGNMDDVRIYNRALSPNEVSQLYNWAPGPVGWWKLDENTGTNAYDSSGTHAAGTIESNIKWVPGKFGSATRFVDNNHEIALPSSVTVKNLAQFTIEMWVYPRIFPSSDISDMYYETVADDGGYTRASVILANSATYSCLNKFLFSFRTGLAASTRYNVCGNTTLSVNNWYHVAAVFDSVTGIHKIYLNGALDGSLSQAVSAMPNTNPVQEVTLGQYATADITLDDVRMYNYARTPAQIVEDMNGGHPAPGSPVGSAIGHWNFDEGYGDTAHNTGNGGAAIDGNLGGSGTSCPGGSSLCPTWANNGKFDKALTFNGTSSYVDVYQSGTWNLTATDDQTVSAWINLPADLTGTYGTIWGDCITSGPCFQLHKISAGNYTLNFYDGSTQWQSNTLSFSFGTWYHVVQVKNGTSSIIWYRNGVEVGKVISPSIIDSTPDAVRIGNDQSNEAFKGSIDEVKVYKSALTSDQIKTEYNQGMSAVLGSLSDTSNLMGGSAASNSASAAFCVPGSSDPCSPPVGWWKFDENTGSAANDSSGNGYNATWYGTGTPHWNQGKNGSAGNFDGSSDYVSNMGNILNFSGDFTLESWFRSTTGAASSIRTIIAKANTAGSLGYALRLDNSSSDAEFIVFNTSNADWLHCYSTTAVIADNKWHQVTGTVSGSNLYVYMDGVLECTDTTTSGTRVTNSPDDFVIGLQSISGRYWLGQLDDTRVYNYARTPAQVAWDYNRGAPAAQYDFNECGGTILHNSASKSDPRTVTTLNGTIYPQSLDQVSVGDCSTNANTMWYNGRTGKYSGSLNFDGQDDYVDIPNTGLPTGDFTISAWFKTNTLGDRFVFHAPNTAGGNKLALAVSNPGAGYRLVSFVDGAEIDGATPILDATWYQATLTRLGSSIVMYLNGKPDATFSNAAVLNYGTCTSYFLGTDIDTDCTTRNQYWKGQIDDVRVYNYALTPIQVQTLYNGGAAVKF